MKFYEYSQKKHVLYLLSMFPPPKKTCFFVPIPSQKPLAWNLPQFELPSIQKDSSILSLFLLRYGRRKSIPRCCEKKLQLSSLMVSSNPRKGLCTNWLDDSQWERMCHSKLLVHILSPPQPISNKCLLDWIFSPRIRVKYSLDIFQTAVGFVHGCNFTELKPITSMFSCRAQWGLFG